MERWTPKWDNEDEANEEKGNDEIRKLRKDIKLANAAIKVLMPEVQQLRGYKDNYEREQRQERLGTAFTELGLPLEQIDLYEADDSFDGSPESVKDWAKHYGILPNDSESDGDPSGA